MAPRSAILNVMTSAAIKAGKAVLRDFGELDKLQVSRKGTADFATGSDKRSERILHQELSKARPQAGFLMEESGEITGKDNTRFVIDPIDGTHNFIHAVPYFCISLAYEKQIKDGSYETQAGVIYDLLRNELFCAELYQGATVNDRRLQVSGRSDPEMCMIATYVPTHKHDHAARVHTALIRFPSIFRATGSTALDLAYVAAGRYDAACFIAYRHWDVAAGRLLVREAGGQLSEFGESSKPCLLASNALIHGKLASSLAVA